MACLASIKEQTISVEDPRFLDRLEQLARDAERVSATAEGVIRAISGSEEYLGSFWARGLHQIATGPLATFPEEDREKEVRLFWDSIRTLVAAQFGAFSLTSRDAIRNIEATCTDLSRQDKHPRNPTYWRFVGIQGDEPRFAFARAFTILAQYSIVLPRLGAGASEPKRICVDLINRIHKKLKEYVTWPKPELIWPVALWKLIRILLDKDEFAKLGGAQYLEEYDDKLRQALGLHLQNDTAPACEVADMASVLGGRFLNPTSLLDPVHSELYGDAVAYCLKWRNTRDGSWNVEYNLRGRVGDPPTSILQNPLVGKYSPLAFLLSLPNSVLTPHIREIADTSAAVLGALKRELGSYSNALPVGREDRVTDAVLNGLLIGVAVADRLRDLLSDVELDQLKADVPARTVEWNNLVDSLGFKDNLQKGVIDKWKSLSDERPGAILVFGPPGTGKTTIAKALLHELNKFIGAPVGRPNEEWRFLALTPADFAREGADKVIASAERLFRRLQRVRRCVVLLDEMEEFLRARGPDESAESRLITTAFLPLLQETVSRREIILIVATNFVGTIDPAVTRRGRFDLILPLGPPDRESRRKIVQERLKREGIDIDIAAVVDNTMAYTRDEVIDYIIELGQYLAEDVMRHASVEDGLNTLLWRFRQERVPMALSGKPGCDWRVFRDEAARFRRGATGATKGKDGDSYWKEPAMPLLVVHNVAGN